jgi:hypothetical protein
MPDVAILQIMVVDQGGLIGALKGGGDDIEGRGVVGKTLGCEERAGIGL